MGFNIPGGGAKYSPPQKSAPALLNPGPPPAPPPQHSAPALLNPAHVYQAPVHSAPALLNPAPNQVHQNPMPVPRGGTDAQSSGPGYGSAQANAYKQSAGYKLAIAQTFLHQAAKQQSLIVKGAVSNPSYEGSIVLNLLHGRAQSAGMGFGDVLKAYGVDVGSIADAKNPALHNTLGDMITGGLGRMFNHNTAQPAGSTGMLGSVTPFGGQKGATQILKNTASDAVHLIPNTLQGIAGIGNQIGQGHFDKALGMVVDPYVHLFTHPSDALAHPLNTAMMLGGPETALGRGAGSIARSGVLGDAAKAAAGTARAPLRLGPDVAGGPTPIIESRSYSPNLVTKGIQVANETRLRKRGLDPNVSRPKSPLVPTPIANSLNIGLEAKTRQIPNEMTAGQQMGSRENRSIGMSAVNKARPSSKAAQGVVAHYLQGVIRTPETAVADATKEINRLRAVQATLPRSAALFSNRMQIRSLDKAIKEPGALKAAFDSSQHVRNWFNARDAYMVEKGIIGGDQAMRSKLFPYAQAHMGAKYDFKKGELVDHAGAPLATQTILDHIAGKHDPNAPKMPDPAFVGHYSAKLAPYRFFSAYKAARGTLSGMKRTGEAFRKGNYDHSFEGLVAQAARTEQAATKAGLHDRIVNRMGIGKPEKLQNPHDPKENGYWTKTEAAKFAQASIMDDHGNPIPGAQPLTPIAAFNHKTPISAVSDVLHPNELAHVDGLELKALQRAIDEGKLREAHWDEHGKYSHTTLRDNGERNIVLVPHNAMDQFAQQFKPAGSGARKLGQVTQQFKRTVLPYSTHWMTQIGSEAVLRGLVAGVIDPRNIVAGHQIMNELKQHGEEGKNIARETTNATFYNAHDPLAKHNPNPGMINKAVHATPLLGNKGLIGAHNLYANAIGHAMGRLEHEFRVMGLGKLSRRQLQEFTGQYQATVRLQGKNVDLLANRLRTDPALVTKFGREIDNTFGKYTKLSPNVRAAVQSFVPFLPWYLNAAKFVLWNLPVKHPVASALMASLRQTLTQDVQDGKQMPLNAYQAEALGKFTPWGILPPDINTGSVINTLSAPVLPEATGAYNITRGLNVFGDQALKGPHGTVKANTSGVTAPAIEAFLESMLPLLRDVRTAREGGKTPWGTSTALNPQTKPGSSGNVFDRIFNPLHAYEQATKHPPRTGSTSSSSDPFKAKASGKPDPFAQKTSVGSGGPDPFK